jgi:hypothetical protein
MHDNILDEIYPLQMAPAKRIEMEQLLSSLRKDDESPGDTILRALRVLQTLKGPLKSP